MKPIRALIPIFIVITLFISLASVTVAEDITPPVSTLTINQPLHNQTIDGTSYRYVNASTSFNLTAADANGTISGIWYRVWSASDNWTDWTNYTGNFTIDALADGFHYIEYFAGDNSSNNESINNQTVFINNRAPRAIHSWPMENSINNSWESDIFIEFNEPMNKTSVEDFILIEPAMEIDSYSWSNNDTNVSISLKENMESDTTYTVMVLKNATDLMGHNLKNNFTFDFTTWTDVDDDDIPDFLDTDNDNDGVEDVDDPFPLDTTETVDTDDDGIGDNADEDDDNDGVDDDDDAFPLDHNETADSDGDGIGDNADTDDDNDDVIDIHDAFPLDSSEHLDTDRDGVGNNADTDDDGDNVTDTEDIFPLDKSEWADFDGDGIGDNADTDDDGDGFVDIIDPEPLNADVGRPGSGIYNLYMWLAIMVAMGVGIVILLLKGPW